MKMLEFSPRPEGLKDIPERYVPGTDLATFAFAEQFLVWATRAAHMGSDRGFGQVRLDAAFAAIDAPDALPCLLDFLRELEGQFGRPLAAPCFKWRALLADEARVLTLIARFQEVAAGARETLPKLPAPLLQTGQRLALALGTAGLHFYPLSSHATPVWPDGMPVMH
jgi:hypothetical protein